MCVSAHALPVDGSGTHACLTARPGPKHQVSLIFGSTRRRSHTCHAHEAGKLRVLHSYFVFLNCLIYICSISFLFLRFERYGYWVRGWAFPRSAPSANQPTRSEPADEVPPAAMVEHDDPTDECVGVTTCTTNESSPDSHKKKWARVETYDLPPSLDR